MGCGIGGYFALPTEPPLWVGWVILAFFLCQAAILWRFGRLEAVSLILLALVALGFSVAQTRTVYVSAPVLTRPIGPIQLDGRVSNVEPDGGRVRVTLDGLSMERLKPDQVPSRVRVSMSAGWAPMIGQRVRLTARLVPPPFPGAPGAFDFPRRAWFEQLGAVGYAVVRPQVLATPPAGAWTRTAVWIDSLRLTVATRLHDGVGGASGGVAAALATGMRGLVPEDVIEAYRISGLAHLLAISGLHMGLAAGLVFVVVRAILALIPPVALRWDIKKITAMIAMVMMVFYLLLSGANVPAQRAFLMGWVVLGAVLLDRSAITLRLLAVAAVIVLLFQPEALVGPSFQMSFAAVTALVAVYEVTAPALSRWRVNGAGLAGPAMRAVVLYGVGILLSTAIAGLATAPYAAFHFHRLSAWGVAANLAAMPIMAAWVMPWLVMALLLMPFGWDGLAMGPLRLGLDQVEAVARTVADWPGAVVAAPPMSALVLSVITLAGVWLCIWRGRWRHAAWPVLLVALAVPWLEPRPDVVVSADGKLLAVQGDGGMLLSPGRGDAFERALWGEIWGKDSTGFWSDASGSTPPWVVCDDLGCVYERQGRRIAVVRHEAALAEDCAKAEAVVSLVPATQRSCRSSRLVAPWDLSRLGAHALYFLADGGVRIDTVAARRGIRPWTGEAKGDDDSAP